MRQLEGEARLADATRPGQGQQRRRLRDAPCLGQDLLATDERRQLARQVAGLGVDGADGRKGLWQAACRDLEEVLCLGEVLQPMLAEVGQADVGRQHAGDEVVGRARDEDLAAVADARDACRPVDVEPDVADPVARRLAGVDAHPHADRAVIRPGVPDQRALRGDGGRDRGVGAREGEVEAVAGRALLDPFVLAEGRPEQAMMVDEQIGVASAERLQQLRRALDVGEHEGHGPDRYAGRGGTRARVLSRHGA